MHPWTLCKPSCVCPKYLWAPVCHKPLENYPFTPNVWHSGTYWKTTRETTHEVGGWGCGSEQAPLNKITSLGHCFDEWPWWRGQPTAYHWWIIMPRCPKRLPLVALRSSFWGANPALFHPPCYSNNGPLWPTVMGHCCPTKMAFVHVLYTYALCICVLLWQNIP